MSRGRAKPIRLSTVMITALLACVLAAGIATLYIGWDYYHTPLPYRSDHALHPVFAPAHGVGLAWGILALTLFVANLVYLLRKKWQRIGGSLRSWLNFHVASGLIGGAITALHAAFYVRSEVTRVCIWSLLIVLGTGLVGRYMVRWIPRNRYGDRLSFADLQEQIVGIVDELRPAVVHDPRAVAVLQAMTDAADERLQGTKEALSFRRALGRLAKVKAGMQLLAQVARHAPTGRLPERQLGRLLRRVRRSYRQAALIHVASRAMSSWRAFHRVLSIIFVATVIIHVVWAFDFIGW